LIHQQNGCSDSYPQELEQFIGDPMLFKVRKEESCDSCGGILIEVLDVLIDSNIIEVYLNPTHAAYCHIVSYIWFVYSLSYVASIAPILTL
jgi:hypothetical protein